MSAVLGDLDEEGAESGHQIMLDVNSPSGLRFRLAWSPFYGKASSAQWRAPSRSTNTQKVTALLKPFLLAHKMNKELKNKLSSAFANDLNVRYNNSNDLALLLTNISRALTGVHYNMIRSSSGLSKAAVTSETFSELATTLLSHRPLTGEAFKNALLMLPTKQQIVSGHLSEWQCKTATGITRFMSLSRSAMRYGESILDGKGIVAELQNDYVRKQQIAKFNDKHFYRSREWKELRLAVLVVSQKCALCGATKDDGKSLHVDHVKPRSLWPELSLDPSNMQVLCAACNMAKSNVLSERF